MTAAEAVPDICEADNMSSPPKSSLKVALHDAPVPKVDMPRTTSKTLRFSLHDAHLEPEWQRRLERFANAVVRGAGTGLCLRGGLSAVSAGARERSCWIFWDAGIRSRDAPS